MKTIVTIFFLLASVSLFGQKTTRQIAQDATNMIMKSISPNTGNSLSSNIIMMSEENSHLMFLLSCWKAKINMFADEETFCTISEVYFDYYGKITNLKITWKNAAVKNAWSSTDVAGALAVIVAAGAVASSSSSSNNQSSYNSSPNSSSSSSSSVAPAPGRKSMGGVEILSWNATNNLLTSGNNYVTFRMRNKNSYAVNVKIDLLNNDGEWKRDYKEYYISAGSIIDCSTLGEAWETAKDIRIAYVQ